MLSTKEKRAAAHATFYGTRDEWGPGVRITVPSKDEIKKLAEKGDG